MTGNANALTAVSGAPAPPRYRITDLGTTGGIFFPRDINESGQVVGETSERNAALWKPTTLNGPDGGTTTIGAVSGIPFTVFHAINDAGVSVGEAYSSAQDGAAGNRAIRRASSGQITTFPDERGGSSTSTRRASE